jgi:hypothetical protein
MSELGQTRTLLAQVRYSAHSGSPDALSPCPKSATSRPSGRGQDGTIRACTASGEYASFQSETTG